MCTSLNNRYNVSFKAVVFKPVLQAPLPCTFCMCPLSDTPDSTHQLVSRDCKTWAVSQYQVRKVRTCVLGSSDFTSSTRECELPRMGEHKSGNSANGTAVYLIVSSPVLQYDEIRYQTPLPLFVFMYINSRKNIFQGTYIHYSENKYYIKQRCLFSVSFKI